MIASLQDCFIKPGLILVFAALTVLANSSTASADNLAAFELRGVQVQMKDGRQLSGYVRFFPSSFTSPDASARFPRILLDPKAWDRKPPTEVWLYKKVFPVSGTLSKHLYVKKFLVSARSEVLKLKLSEIARIKAAPRMKHNGYEGDYEVPLHSAFAIRLLTGEKPHAVISGNGVVDGLIISYTPQIGKKKLERIREQARREPAQRQQERMIRLAERRRVVFLNIPAE